VSVKAHVYDDEHGNPVVITVTTGTFDVSRQVALLNSGRCEDIGLARKITSDVRRHRGGRAALKTLRDHGGPDLLEEVPSEPDELRKSVHRAICDPGAFCKRQRERRDGEWIYESITHWGMRAVMAATGQQLNTGQPGTAAFRVLVTEDGEVGLTCPEAYTGTGCLFGPALDPERLEGLTLGGLVAAALAHTGRAAEESHAEQVRYMQAIEEAELPGTDPRSLEGDQ